MKKEVEEQDLHCHTYVAAGAVNIENIEHVENLFPGNPEIIASILGKSNNPLQKPTDPDEDIHMAIDDLYDAEDENGKKIFTDQGHWYAVHRVLKEYYDYPTKMSSFVRLIQQKEWEQEQAKCVYSSITYISKMCPLLSIKVSLWDNYKDINDTYKGQYLIAKTLMKILGLTD